MCATPHQTILVGNNIASVRKRIERACWEAGRDPDTVQLLAVSKTKPDHLIRDAHDAGLSDMGENYIQEAEVKMIALQDIPVIWHFIGQIQSNKTRQIAENYDWVHTLSSIKVAGRLDKQRPKDKGRLNVLIQVNVSRDPAKNGIDPENLHNFLGELQEFDRLLPRGLMTMPSKAETLEEQRKPFALLKQLLYTERESYGDRLESFDQLSMGMSQDLEAAILEGATWVRVGTDIFGERN